MGVTQWLQDRRAKDDAAVLKAIRMLRPSQAWGRPIGRLAHLSPGRTYAALDRLEDSGWLVSEWSAGDGPRCRVYKVASAVGLDR